MSPAWPDLIGLFILLKQEIAEWEPSGSYTYHVSHAGASPAELVALEEQVGSRLDPEYREFLGFANGWPDFSLSVQLMGTGDFTGPLKAMADEYLSVMLPYQGEDLKDAPLLPTAVAARDKDVFVVGRPGSPLAGQVV